MATIIPPAPRRSLSESHQRVRSPLTRLRGYIRTYVSLEGALLLVLYLALWFWIGLALDYGFFKLFGIDVVQEWPWAARLILLLVVTAGLLTTVSLKVVGRLLREFRDPALALVLERRFPELLGDRLITAVELSDLQKAEEQGYSPAMIRETIHEAAERVQQVPVQQAFDWGRLIRRGLIAAALTLGLYLAAGGLCLALDSAHRVHAGRTGYSRFNETAAIWFERNILLQNTIWPRRAQLELIGFEGKELRVGKDNKVPPLRVRALEYVIADTKYPEGWRPLTWEDLTTHRNWIFGGPPPLPPFALTPRDSDLGLTVDEVALRNRKFEVRTLLGGKEAIHYVVTDPAVGGQRPLLWADLTPERLDGLTPPKAPAAWKASDDSVGLTVDDVVQTLIDAHNAGGEPAADANVVLSRLDRLALVSATLDQVDALAAKPSMSRTMRKLVVPDIIYLKCTGDKTYLRNEMRKTQDNEYTGNFGDLKESVVFTVQGEDYYTPRRYITLVPAPSLIALGVLESRPAYLFYRPDDKTSLADLRGKKQPFEERDVLQAGSETSRIDVPAGTDVALTAKSDKELKEAFLKAAKTVDEVRLVADLPGGGRGVVAVKQAKAGEQIQRGLELLPDHKGFRLELPDVRRDLVFDFEFTDTDGVKGKRKVVVKPQDDTAPELTDARVEVMRKTTIKAKDRDETYFMVTRKARIPLGAKVHDDHTLGDVRYRYTLTTASKTDVNAVFTAPVVALTAPGGSNPFMAAAYLLGQDRDAQTYAPPLFAQNVAGAKEEFLPMQTIKELLGQGQKLPFRQLVHDFDIQPDVISPFREDKPFGVQDDRLACDFPLWKLMPQALEDNHPYYRMDLWMEATDTDADEQLGTNGVPIPHLSKSKETFSFLIVPESVLLMKIGEDEGKQYASLNKRYQELQEKAQALDVGVHNLERPDVQVKDLLAPSTRAEQSNETIENCLATTREVYANYQRMVREEQLNLIQPKKIVESETRIVVPLGKILEGTPGAADEKYRDGNFPAVLEANGNFRKALDEKGMSDKDRIDASRVAGKELNRRIGLLMANLNEVLEVMRGLEGLDSLIQRADLIAKGVHNQELTAAEIKKRLEDSFFDEPAPKK
jgi:hypothetical protein